MQQYQRGEAGYRRRDCSALFAGTVKLQQPKILRHFLIGIVGTQ